MIKDSRIGNETEHKNPFQSMFNALDELNAYLLKLCKKRPKRAAIYGIDSEAQIIRRLINEIHKSHVYNDINIHWLVDALNQCALDVSTMKNK